MASRLDRLAAEIRACRICRDTPAGKRLPHEPRPVLRVSKTARIGIFGQAPGTRVHASGKPFTDPSGDRLREWMGVNEAEFYDAKRVAIVPMGFCFPGLNAKGADLPPRSECAPAWRQRLMDELANLELVLLVGRYAQAWHLADAASANLSETVRDWRRFWDLPNRPRYVPTPHPSWRNNAWLKKNPWFADELLPPLRAEIRRLLEA